MRLIKFRAWIPKHSMICEVGTVDFIEEKVQVGSFEYKMDNVELMQWTGLVDRTGKEIFEGDILKQTYHAETGSYDDGISFDGHHLGVVVITASKGACMRKPLCYSEETDETNISNQYKSVAGYRSEVIGNVFENPGLISP